MVITQTYVAFAFGLSLPLIFPIVGFSFFSLYISERIKFAYFCRKPTILNNHLNDKVYQILEGAPLAMIIVSYWQLGNRQMFFNEVGLKENQSDIISSNHQLFDFSKGVDHTVFLLCFFPILLYYNKVINFMIWVGKCFKMCKNVENADEIIFG